MIAGHEVVRVSVGGLRLEASGKKASGVSGASLSDAGPNLASRGSYSKTSGMPANVGEKADERGVAGWCDIWVRVFSFGDCCPLRGGEGRTGCCLGARGESGMEGWLLGQSGTEKRLNMEPVCFADWLRRASHRGGENSSMSRSEWCDAQTVLHNEAEVRDEIGKTKESRAMATRRVKAGSPTVLVVCINS
jgi:hypothetical protein